jgi:NAD(P)-dependent dehydrogenase (short-subunit alcohol dehydrogenase family)
MQYAPDFRMDGKCALLTGAARGIGLGIARAFAAMGASVAIQDIDLAEAQAQATKIAEAGGRAIALGGDITDRSLGETLVAEAATALGGLHVLVNNAAIQREVRFMELTSDAFATTLNANLILPMRLCQEAAKIFVPQRWGRIVNLSSVQQFRGSNVMIDYAAGKAALAHLTRTLARELAQHNVTVNALAPGWYKTLRNAHQFTDPQVEREIGAKNVPLGRIGYPEDCAGAAVLLCSTAGEYITGQVLSVDGGLTT